MTEENQNQSQDQNVTPSSPVSNNQTPPVPETTDGGTEKTGAGPILGAVIIVILLAIGGYYFWTTYLEETTFTDTTNEQIMEEEPPTAEELQVQSSSDAIDDIEMDLDASEFNNLDAELNDIEGELTF
ncbi:MAG: hypothetical protein Q8P86_00355 [bacterium]|nr:hypothetical protein [bacterium]